MTSTPPGDGNPYAVPDAPAEPHPAYGSPASAGGGVSPEQRASAVRRARRTVLLSALAILAAVFLAPVGVLLGVLVVVRAVMLRAELRRARIGSAAVVIPVAGGIAAIIIGLTISILAIVFGEQILDYRDCMSGANTKIAQDRCYSDFRDAVDERLGR